MEVADQFLEHKLKTEAEAFHLAFVLRDKESGSRSGMANYCTCRSRTNRRCSLTKSGADSIVVAMAVMMVVVGAAMQR